MREVSGPALTCRGFTIATDVDAAQAARIEADARLIAAAPDLLEALRYYAEQFCEGFCKDLPQAGTYHTDMDDQCSGCKARAAIAKATGEA
jgi:hypothetical protein